MAPASVNGVATTGWPWRAISIRPSPISASRRSGEFVLMIVISDGSRASRSRSMPRSSRAISIASSTTTAPVPRQCQVLSSSVANTRYWSRWRVATGRSVGSSGPPPSWWMTSRAPIEPDVLDHIGDGARPAAAIEIAHEGRSTHRTKHDVRATEDDVPIRVAGVQGERRRRQRDERLHLGGIESDAVRRPVDDGARCGERIERAIAITSTPISDRMRNDARWIVSSWSSDSTSSGRNGLTSRRHGSCAIPGAGRRGRRRMASVVVMRGDGTPAGFSGASQMHAVEWRETRVGPRPGQEPWSLTMTAPTRSARRDAAGRAERVG